MEANKSTAVLRAPSRASPRAGSCTTAVALGIESRDVRSPVRSLKVTSPNRIREPYSFIEFLKRSPLTCKWVSGFAAACGDDGATQMKAVHVHTSGRFESEGLTAKAADVQTSGRLDYNLLSSKPMSRIGLPVCRDFGETLEAKSRLSRRRFSKLLSPGTQQDQISSKLRGDHSQRRSRRVA